MSEYKLPELPHRKLFTGEYTADQMREYALAALRQQADETERLRVQLAEFEREGW